MVRLGVTTVEAKSGYGLDLETELRLLRVYGPCELIGPARIVATFLGAHTVPAEYPHTPCGLRRPRHRRDDPCRGRRGNGPVLRRVRGGERLLGRGGATGPAGGEGGGLDAQAARRPVEFLRRRRAGGRGRSRFGGSSGAHLGCGHCGDEGGRGRGGEPSTGHPLPRSRAPAGTAHPRGRPAAGGGHRFQSRLRAKLSTCRSR